MTKNEYHAVLVQKLELANTDLQIWPPGISPGTLQTGVAMDEVSHSSLTSEHENPIIAELDSLASYAEVQDFKPRHDEFMKILARD